MNVFERIWRGIKAWLNSAPGCSSCRVEFGEEPPADGGEEKSRSAERGSGDAQE